MIEEELEEIFSTFCILSAYHPTENKWMKRGAGEATLFRSARGEVKLDMKDANLNITSID